MTGLSLTVLGASGTYPIPDSAATGYLVRNEATAVWVDCGTGTFANLQRHIDRFDLEAVVLSHTHLDHILDLYPLYYSIHYGADERGPIGLPVYAPKDAEATMASLLGDGKPCGEEVFDGYLTFKRISDGDDKKIGTINFKFKRSIHPKETLAMRISSDGRTLAYTADTGKSPDLAEFFRGSHTLISEASTHEEDPNLTEVHMTAEQAGQLASDAGVERLVLTHITPGLDPQISVKLAAQRFSGEIVIAKDNLVLEI